MKISQNLSSNSLFHFVNRIDYLKDILINGFQARYVVENFPLLEIPFAIPMKCFCDIPLGLIKKHLVKYGRYGVGISKDFAMQEGITPCFYVHENSDTLLNYLKQIKFDDIKDSILPFFKQYEVIDKSNKKIFVIDTMMKENGDISRRNVNFMN